MKEYEVALEKVSPFLRDQLSWPEKLISSYGRTPVQIGATTVRAMSPYTDPQGREWIHVGTLHSYGLRRGAEVWRSPTGEPGSLEYVRTLPGSEGVRGATTYKGLLWLGTANLLKPGECKISVIDGTIMRKQQRGLYIRI